MYKLSQRELLEEGLWDKFKDTKVGRGLRKVGQFGAEIAKVVAPNTSSQVGSIVQKYRDAKQNISQAGRKMEDRVIEFLDGYSLMPDDSEVKMLKSFPNGDSQWRVKVGKKDVDPNTGESKVVQRYNFPIAIILHDKKSNSFKFLTEPAQRRTGAVNNTTPPPSTTPPPTTRP